MCSSVNTSEHGKKEVNGWQLVAETHTGDASAELHRVPRYIPRKVQNRRIEARWMRRDRCVNGSESSEMKSRRATAGTSADSLQDQLTYSV